MKYSITRATSGHATLRRPVGSTRGQQGPSDVRHFVGQRDRDDLDLTPRQDFEWNIRFLFTSQSSRGKPQPLGFQCTVTQQSRCALPRTIGPTAVMHRPGQIGASDGLAWWERFLSLKRRAGRQFNKYASLGLRHPSWLLMFVFGRVLVARKLHRALTRRKSPECEPGAEALFPRVDATGAAQRMRRDGIYAGLELPDAILHDIVAFSFSASCFGNSDSKAPLKIGSIAEADGVRDFVIADYREAIESCGAIRRLQRDPVLLTIAESYLGTSPILLRSRLWWSFYCPDISDRERESHSQTFHFDLDDWRSAKFFFYLTDTDVSSGAHQFVRGSLTRRPWTLQLTPFKACGERAVQKYYRPDDILTLTGHAGFGFVEDPFGLHRGIAPKRRARLMLEIEYGCSPQPVAGRYGAA